MLLRILGLALLALTLSLPARAQAQGPWADVLQTARGQTVYFNHWGGNPLINAYVEWAAAEVAERHGVTLVPVKVDDIATTVTRVLTEKTAGRDTGGTVDLLWVNGENFAAMKENGLLYGPFAEALPNFALVDTEGKPTTLVDFTIPTDGLESPWGMAQFVFIYDAQQVPEPPATLEALKERILAHPGRFTYPRPPDFYGSTFLKQVLLSSVADPALLASPPPADAAAAEAILAPLWAWLEVTHPAMWRGGRDFPESGPALQGLFADGAVDFAVSFSPTEASAKVLAGVFADSTRTAVLETGTIGNTHFVAIPYNANAPEGAQVVANFLLSPEAQARKADPQYWGDPTVLALDKLSEADRGRFEAIDFGPATLPPEALGTVLPEPHPDWMVLIEAKWAERYR